VLQFSNKENSNYKSSLPADGERENSPPPYFDKTNILKEFYYPRQSKKTSLERQHKQSKSTSNLRQSHDTLKRSAIGERKKSQQI